MKSCEPGLRLGIHQALSGELEQTGSENGDMAHAESLLRSVAVELRRIGASAAPFLKAPRSSNAPALDARVLNQASLDALLALIEAQDLSACKRFRQLRGALEAALGTGPFARLHRARRTVDR